MDNACCAHKTILGKVTKPDTNGYVRDYWICGDCGTEMKIEPVATLQGYYLIDRKTALEVGNILHVVIQDRYCMLSVKDTVHRFNSGLHITDCVPDDFK